MLKILLYLLQQNEAIQLGMKRQESYFPPFLPKKLTYTFPEKDLASTAAST